MSITIELPPSVEQRLLELARQTGRSKDDVLRDAIANALEDIEDIMLAERAVTRLRNGESRILTDEELERELGLDS